jgi:hypothetical protein
MINAFSSFAMGQLADALGGGAVVVVDMAPLVDAVDRLGRTAGELLDAVKNPRATAADELFRRGVKALSHEWVDDAVRELEESIKIDRYRSGPYLMLAVARQHQDDALKTMANLHDAVLYAENGEHREGVTAALYAAWLADKRPLAREVLERARKLGAGSSEVVAALLVREPTLALQEQYVEWMLASKGGEVELPEAVLGEPLQRARKDIVHALGQLLVPARELERVLTDTWEQVQAEAPWPAAPVELGLLPATLCELTNLNEAIAVSLSSAIVVAEACLKDTRIPLFQQIQAGDGLLSASHGGRVALLEAWSLVDKKVDELDRRREEAYRERHNRMGLVPSIPRQSRQRLKLLETYIQLVTPIVSSQCETLRLIVSELPRAEDLRGDSWQRIFPSTQSDLVRPLVELPLNIEFWPPGA